MFYFIDKRMNKQLTTTKSSSDLKRLKIFGQESRRKTNLVIQTSCSPKYKNQVQKSNLQITPISLKKDFREIKQQISIMKKELGQFLNQKRTLSSLEHIEAATVPPGSPTSILHYFSQLMMLSENEKKNTSFSSDQSEQNFYKIKYNLIFEQLECMKKKYANRKLKYKQSTHKLEKQISVLQNIVERNEKDIKEYKNLLSKQISSLRKQINNCTQSQIINRGESQQKQQKYFELLTHERKMNYSLILDPTYETRQYVQLKGLVEEKQSELTECLENMEKMRFQNLYLEDLLESKEKQQKQLMELKKQYETQKFLLNQIINKLRQEKQLSNRYREELINLNQVRQIQYDHAREQQTFLRAELQSSLLRLSSMETQFRDLENKRSELASEKYINIQLELVEKNTKLFNAIIQLDAKQKIIGLTNSQQVILLSDHLNDSKKKLQCIKDQFQQIQLIKIENSQLKKENEQIRNKLVQSSQNLLEIKNNYEQQLYNQQICFRRRLLQYEDKIKQFGHMVQVQVSDVILRQQDLQLLQKQQQIHKLNLLLVESKLRICCLEGEIILSNELKLVQNAGPHQQCNEKLRNMQYKNTSLENLAKILKLQVQVYKIRYKNSQTLQLVSDVQSNKSLLTSETTPITDLEDSQKTAQTNFN